MRDPRHKKISIISKFFTAILLLLLSAALFLTGLVFYLKQRPEELAMLLAREIETRSGLVCTVRSFGVTLFPKPMLTLVDVDIRGARFALSTPYVTIWPRLAPLLHGEFLPGEISLFQARWYAGLDHGGDAAPAPTPPLLSVLPPLLDGCALVLRHSSVHLEAPNATLRAEDVDSRVLLDFRSPQGEATLARASLTYASWPALTLSDARLELREAFHAMRGNTAGPGGNLRMEGRVDFPGMLSAAAVELAARERTGQADIRLQLRVQGNVPARGADLPIQARLAAGGTYNAFEVEALELRLEETAFRLAGLFERGENAPAFSGKLEFEAFSLPRYFAFARRLPSAVRRSLDRLRGYLDFRLDAQGLEAPNVRCATSHGAIFTGAGGVKSFAKPEIFLDVRSASVNLDEEFPDILQRGVTPLEYGHEPLVGAPDSPEYAVLSNVGYDIRIRAAHALVASSQARELALHCSPGAKGPLCGFDANKLFDGHVQGKLAVSEGTPLSYALQLNARNLDLKLMKKLLPAKHQLTGSVSGHANVRFEGDNLETALSRLGGVFSLRLEEGGHAAESAGEAAKAERSPLPVYALSGSFQSQERQGERLGYTGTWQTEIQNGDWRVDAQLDGPISIARQGFFPLRLSRVPGTLRIQRTKAWQSLMPRGLQAECSGKFSLDSEQPGVALEEARMRLFDCDMTGHLHGKYAKEGFEAQGRIHVKGASLRQSLAKLGMGNLAMNPALLQAFSGSAAVAVSPGKLAVSELAGQIDQSRFSGSLSGEWTRRPAWQGNVQIDALDLQSYLDPGPAPKKTKAWDMKFLQDFDAKGVIGAQRLRLSGMHFRQARVPVQLNGGVLELSPITAELYGGPVTARLRMNAGKTPDVQASVRASGVDLRAFSDERGMDTLYEGKASVQIELAGSARSGADIPAGLSGGFFCETGKGSMQARKKLQQEGAVPTRFDRIVISGPVERGVFRSERFQLDGPMLRAGGGGWINMPEGTLDLKLEARMAGFPPVPVHIHGKIDKPRISVQAGAALVKAMGRLGLGMVDGIEAVGSGLLDVVGGVLSVPFKLLK